MSHHYVDRERVLTHIDVMLRNIRRDASIPAEAVRALETLRERIEALPVVTRGR